MQVKLLVEMVLNLHDKENERVGDNNEKRLRGLLNVVLCVV